MTTQTASIDKQIAALTAQKAAVLSFADLVKDTPLANASCMLHPHNLYGSVGCVSVKADANSRALAIELLPFIVGTVRETGFYSYKRPNTEAAQAIITAKEPNGTRNRSETQATAETGDKDYSVSAYLQINGTVFCVKFDYTKVIINENYSTMAKGNKVPHLRSNPRFNRHNRATYPQLYGVNGASDFTGSQDYYTSYTRGGDLLDLMPEIQ